MFCYPDMTCKMGSEIEAREILGLGYGHKNLVLWESLFHLFASNSTTTHRHSCTHIFSKTKLNFSLGIPDFACLFWVHRSFTSESHWNAKSRMLTSAFYSLTESDAYVAIKKLLLLANFCATLWPHLRSNSHTLDQILARLRFSILKKTLIHFNFAA